MKGKKSYKEKSIAQTKQKNNDNSNSKKKRGKEMMKRKLQW
jgi:hypothetical protein